VGGETGPNPTDRAKRGVKRSVLTDGQGVPLATVVAGANRNDHKLMRETLDAIALPRPKPASDRPQHLCLDKGYDYAEPREIAAEFGFTLHLRTRGEEVAAKRHAGARARRWVVEVVFTQMTKPDVFAVWAGGQHVSDFDVGVGDDHAVDEQQHELAALLEAGLGQSGLHAPAERLQRRRDAGELLLACGVAA